MIFVVSSSYDKNNRTRAAAEAHDGGAGVVLVASRSVRNVALGLPFNDASWCPMQREQRFVLEAVGKSRGGGVLMAQLAKLPGCKGLQSATNCVNPLEMMGLIVKREVMVEKKKTSYLYLSSRSGIGSIDKYNGGGRSRGEEYVNTDAVKEIGRMFEAQLAAAEGGVMAVVDLKCALYMWFRTKGRDSSDLGDKTISRILRRVRDHLEETKVVERIMCEVATVGGGEGGEKGEERDEREDIDGTGGARGNKPKKSRAPVSCLRLLRPSSSTASAATDVAAITAAAAAGGKGRQRQNPPLALPQSQTAATRGEEEEEEEEEKEEEDATGSGGNFSGGTRGGGQLAVNELMEDQVARIAMEAGEKGLRVPDLAKMFKFGNKSFKRRIDVMVTYPELFGCEYRMVQEGKYRITRLYYTGIPTAAATVGATGPRTGAAGASAGASASGSGGSGERIDGSLELRVKRAGLIRRHVEERGYAVKSFLGRWLAQQEGSTIVRVDTKVMNRILSDLSNAGHVREVEIELSTQNDMSGVSVTHTVIFDPAFPEPTEDILNGVKAEIKQTEWAMRQEFWKHNKDVYNVWGPSPTTTTTMTTTTGVHDNTGGGGSGGGADPISAPLASRPTVNIMTHGVGRRPTTRDFEKATAVDRGGAATPDGVVVFKNNKKKLPFKTLRDLAALETGFIPALGLRLRYMHEFFVKAVFCKPPPPSSSSSPSPSPSDPNPNLPGGGDARHSAWFDAGDVVMRLMPLQLFLRIAGCPPRLAEESPETLARLQSLAMRGTLLGDMDSDTSRALLGDASTTQMQMVFKHTELKLSKLLRILDAMGLIEKSEESMTARGDAEGGGGGGNDNGGGSMKQKKIFPHRLKRTASFQPLPGTTDPSEWPSFHVDLIEGHAAYWDGLEAAFKGNHAPFKEDQPPVDMMRAFPNPAMMRYTTGSNKFGLCAPKVWSRLRDMTIEQRIMLLQRLQDLRLEESSKSKRRERPAARARGDATTAGDEEGGGGGGGGAEGDAEDAAGAEGERGEGGEENDNGGDWTEADNRAVARVAALEQKPLTHAQIKHISHVLGLRKEQVDAFHEQDCKRLLDDLIEDGTITREEAGEAERRRNERKIAERLAADEKKKENKENKEKKEKEKEERKRLKNTLNAANAKRRRLGGGGFRAQAEEGEEDDGGGGGGGGGATLDPAKNLEATRAEIGEKLSRESAHTAAYHRMQRGGASEATQAGKEADADKEKDEDQDDHDNDGLEKARSAIVPHRRRFQWTAVADHQLALAIMRTFIMCGNTGRTYLVDALGNGETLPADTSACNRRWKKIRAGARAHEIALVVDQLAARGAVGRNRYQANVLLEKRMGRVSSDAAEPAAAAAADNVKEEAADATAATTTATTTATTPWDTEGKWCQEVDVELEAEVRRILAKYPVARGEGYRLGGVSRSVRRMGDGDDDDEERDEDDEIIGYGRYIGGRIIGDEDDDVPLADIARRDVTESDEDSDDSDSDPDDSYSDSDSDGDERRRRRRRASARRSRDGVDDGEADAPGYSVANHDPEFVTRCANAIELIKMFLLTTVPGVPLPESIKVALAAVGGDAVSFAMDSLKKMKLVTQRVVVKPPTTTTTTTESDGAATADVEQGGGGGGGGGDNNKSSPPVWTLTERFLRQTDDFSTLGALGAAETAANYAQVIEDGTEAAAMYDGHVARRSRCTLPTAAQNLAILSAVVADRVELAPATLDQSTNLPETFGGGDDDSGGGDDHGAVSGAVVNLQAVVLGVKRERDNDGHAVVKVEAIEKENQQEKGGEEEEVKVPSREDVLAAVSASGATGITSKEFAATPAMQALGAGLHACERALMASVTVTVTDGEQPAVEAVNGFDCVRYMTKEHASRFRVYRTSNKRMRRMTRDKDNDDDDNNDMDIDGGDDGVQDGGATAGDDIPGPGPGPGPNTEDGSLPPAAAAAAADVDVDDEGMPIRPWLMADGGGVNVDFLSGLKRRVLGVVLTKPGIPEGDVVRGYLSPALTPRCAAEVIDMMISAGELRAVTGPPEKDEAMPSPLLLLRRLKKMKKKKPPSSPPTTTTGVGGEKPTPTREMRHLFAPSNPAMWPR